MVNDDQVPENTAKHPPSPHYIPQGGIRHTANHERVPSTTAGGMGAGTGVLGTEEGALGARLIRGGSHRVGTTPEYGEADIDHVELGVMVKYRQKGEGGMEALGVPVAIRGKDMGDRVVRTASQIRGGLRQRYDDRLSWLEGVMDGECVEKVQVKLLEVVPYLECPNCGEAGVGVTEANQMREVEVLRSASVKERTAVMEQWAKYGLGQLKEVSVEHVREKVAQTIAVVRRMAGPEVAEQMVRELAKVWKTA